MRNTLIVRLAVVRHIGAAAHKVEDRRRARGEGALAGLPAPAALFVGVLFAS